MNMSNVFRLILMTLLAAAMSIGFARENVGNNNSVDAGPDFESIADAIVIFQASEDMDLHIPSEYERTLQGRVLSFEKAQPKEGSIKHTPRTIISPVYKYGIYRLYLTKFPERDDYYIFARIDLNKK